MTSNDILNRANRFVIDMLLAWKDELTTIFTDKGVMVLFLLAPLAYPILYASIYNTEQVYNVPIAVVDKSGSIRSREYLRAIEATPEVEIEARCQSMAEAQARYQERKVHGILIIPADFDRKLALEQQATVSIYADMSSFIYYKALMMAASFVSRDMGSAIQVERLMDEGLSLQQAKVAASPFSYSYNPVYNPTGGYASFLIPAVFILILHQTLLLGIGMLFGLAYERNPMRALRVPGGNGRGVCSLLMGKSLAYLVIYAATTLYILYPVTRFFDLPHLGSGSTLFLFMLPFLLATVFFAMTVSAFLHNRESSMMLFLFSSIPLLFLSGISWPLEGMPRFWQVLSWVFPSTHGIRGYVHINTMGAELSMVRFEYYSLWLQAILYFLSAYWVRRIQLRRTGISGYELR